MKKVTRRVIIILVSAFLLFLLFLLSFNSLMPIVNARAVQYSRSHATLVINSAVKEVLERGEYSNIIRVSKDADGNVLSLEADTVALNRLKSDVSLKILDTLSSEEKRILRIPIGNLTGMYLLSGRGFDLSIRLIPTDSLVTETESTMAEVGINQSWHRISLKIAVRLGVVILGKHTVIDVTDSIVVADTVIVGRVPDAYTDIEKLDEDTVGDIVDFKAG